MNIKLTKNIDYLYIVGRTFCLSFAYHMYGSNMGSLSVNLISSNGNQTLFSRNGDAGNSWIVTSISIPPSNGKVHIFFRYLQTPIFIIHNYLLQFLLLLKHVMCFLIVFLLQCIYSIWERLKMILFPSLIFL